MQKKKKMLTAVVSVIAVIGVFAILGTTTSSAQTAPDFSLPDINGKAVSLSEFEGKIVIVDFWATWCGPCKMEIPGFVKLQEKYKDDLVIIGISLDQNGPKAVVPFAQEYKINYPVVYGNGEVVKAYGGVNGIPTTFVIDRKGNIQRKYVGYRADSVFEADIKELL
ncbi:MAG: TlpA family protein disulfide reductase [Lentisphaeria bacterium]|nr:TlpA family protein disulfide reductase [Candidatus Neomarinimicrobiota bacterium]MCF7841795.1 TlpA family protein disulfide reductase [Lentisphaeria bacterium]